MSNEIKELMNSPKADDRKQAIRILASWKDESAIPYLSAIYKTDRDPQVRELALKAGRYIKQEMLKPSAPIEKPMLEEDEPIVVNDEQRAHDMMNRAKDEFDDNNLLEAKLLAAKAFALYPKLKEDEYFTGVLGQLFGVPREDAVAELVDFIKNKGKQKKKTGKRYLHEVTLGEMLLDLTIIFLVIVGGVIALNVGLSVAIQGDIAQLTNLMDDNPMTSTSVNGSLQSIQAFLSISPDDIGQAVWSGTQRGIQSIISLLISYFFINSVANGMAGGKGTFNGFVHSTTPLQVLGSIVGYALTFIMLIVYVKGVLNGYADALIASDIEVFHQRVAESSTIATSIGAFLGVLSLVWLVVFTNQISKNYELSFFEGCGTIIGAVMVATCSLYSFISFLSFIAGATTTVVGQ